MDRPHPTLFHLQALISQLSLVERNHHVLGSDRAENDVEHSYTVAMLCWYIHSQHAIKLDMTKVFKYALIHDFVEIYAGDVSTFAPPDERARKIEREAAAALRLEKELHKFKDLVQSLKAYEEKADDEALFVWTVDKLRALILGDLDDWRPFKRLEITYDAFLAKHHEQLENCSPFCKEIFLSLFEYFKTTYYDRPAISDTTRRQA